MNAFRGSHSVSLKAAMIGVIVLALLAPLMLLDGLVSERSSMRQSAYSRVAQGWGGHVVAGGPVLVVPVRYEVAVADGKTQTAETQAYLLPAQLGADVSIELQPEPRRVGIYEVPVYLARIRLSGRFDPGIWNSWREARPHLTWHWDRARVLLPMPQTRELREVHVAKLADRPLTFEPASPQSWRGIEAPFALPQALDGTMAFEIDLTMAGSEGFSVLPLGRETRISMQANWPHPSFSGAFLPTRRTIDESGFRAQWNVLELNRQFGSAWLADDEHVRLIAQSATGATLFQPIDIYQRGERAIKYALVFIALTFLTFFAWEHVSGMRLHPLQYLLVGLALSVFYLLLVALTEHMAFGLAYLIAAGALVCLIGVYVSGALRSQRRGAVVAAAMGATYGFLYLLVLSEDYALLLGAIAVFVALAAVMIVTRRVDWYARSTPENVIQTSE
jgi:inner membrane protein